jgi:hypothetical protein
VNDGRFNRRRRWHPIEHALAALALDDGIVVSDLLEDGRSQADVAYRAEAIARGAANSDAPPDLGDLLEQRDQAWLESLDQRGPCLG